VWSKGHLCPKGTTLGHLHHDPDRLRSPMLGFVDVLSGNAAVNGIPVTVSPG
jgi:anaerobic selenocysteine-containing dehydrogenase